MHAQLHIHITQECSQLLYKHFVILVEWTLNGGTKIYQVSLNIFIWFSKEFGMT